MRLLLITYVLFLASVSLGSGASAQALVTPPAQPLSGPGGSAYTYERVKVSAYGEGTEAYWLFEPAGRQARNDTLPVVLYLHGFNLRHYNSAWLWINHLVRKGNLVIYPRYHAGGFSDPQLFTDRCAAAARKGIERFDGKAHVKADTEKFAMIGHSLGGTMIVNLAARYEHYGLPKPAALMPIVPGDVKAKKGLAALLPGLTEDHSTVEAGTLMLIIAVEDDHIVGQKFAMQMYHNTEIVDAADKDLLILRNDTHGQPSLMADHFLPMAYAQSNGTTQVNAYDYALWRWFDALSDAAFYDGKHRKFALGDTSEQRGMGRWSDGQAVREPTVYKPAPLIP